MSGANLDNTEWLVIPCGTKSDISNETLYPPQRPLKPMRHYIHRAQVKLSALAAMTAWLVRAEGLPAGPLARFREGVAEKDSLKRAHLRDLVQVCVDPSTCPCKALKLANCKKIR